MMALATMAVLLVMVLPGVADAKKHKHHKHKAAEFANGTGTIDTVSFSFNVKAKDNKPSTDSAEGKFSVAGGGIFVKGNLSCLRTARATDGSRIANSVGKVTDSNVVPVGAFVSFDATDSATGDLANATRVASASCHAPTGGKIPISSGNIVVHPLR
jgi:hypothetical protein